MSLLVLLLIILLIFGIGGTAPAWQYSVGWGYGPSSVFTVFLIIVLLLVLFGRL